MASQEDPDAPLALAVTALFLFTAYGVRFYRSPDVPMAIQLLIGVSWFLGFAGVLLLPFDLGDVQVRFLLQPCPPLIVAPCAPASKPPTEQADPTPDP